MSSTVSSDTKLIPQTRAVPLSSTSLDSMTVLKVLNLEITSKSPMNGTTLTEISEDTVSLESEKNV
jgi:hypothetical protein